MSDFFEVMRAFRERFGFEPEIPFPWNVELWAEVLKECLDADSPQPYRDAFKREEELRGDGVW
ncbi:MAG: hypothetical protein F4Z95_11210 [Gammaproteobacteria bacterium]|nr:hypothetical protein [Gammaproteobacteria bacterium]